MKDRSPIKIAAISTGLGWQVSFCVYAIIDTIHPTPPDNVADGIVTDVMLFSLTAPIAVAVWLSLWAFITLMPYRKNVWYGVLLIFYGDFIGWGIYFCAGVISLRALFFPSPLCFGALGGASAGLAAFIIGRFISTELSGHLQHHEIT